MHVTWAHLRKKRTGLQLYTKVEEEKGTQTLETASQLLMRALDHQGDVVKKFETASRLNRHNEALEDLVKRRRQDYKAMPSLETASQIQRYYRRSINDFQDDVYKFPKTGVRVQVPSDMAWLDYDEHVDSLNTMDNEVGVTSPKSTTQTLPSFEEYTSPVTYPEEV
ncbi:hypothetical protein Tco_0670586 [Tanacetum coccineum]